MNRLERAWCGSRSRIQLLNEKQQEGNRQLACFMAACHQAGADHVPGRAENGRCKAGRQACREMKADVVGHPEVQQRMLRGVVRNLRPHALIVLQGCSAASQIATLRPVGFWPCTHEVSRWRSARVVISGAKITVQYMSQESYRRLHYD